MSQKKPINLKTEPTDDRNHNLGHFLILHAKGYTFVASFSSVSVISIALVELQHRYKHKLTIHI